jgi:hypothetical protein
MMCRALFTDCSVEKEKRASTSVETLPGTICRISFPNCTSRLSRVASTWFSISVPAFLPYATAASISFSYSGFLDAARMSEGLVVASWGWYFLMVAKSPESATTVWRVLVVHLLVVGAAGHRHRISASSGEGVALHGGVLTVPEAFSWSRELVIVVVCGRCRGIVEEGERWYEV